MSLRTQLVLLFTLLSLGASAVIGGLAYRASESILRRNALASVQTAAHEREGALLRRLAGQRSRASSFLAATAAECASEERCRYSLAVLRATEGFSGAVLTRPGQPPLGVGTVAGVVDGGSWPARQLARFARRADGGPYYVIRADGAGGAVLSLRFDDLHALRDIFADRAGLGSSGETFLADRAGIFLTTPRYAAAQGYSHPVNSIPMRRCLAGQDGATLAADYRNARVIHAFRYIEEIGGGCIMAHIHQTEAFAPVGTLSEHIIGSGLLLAAGALILSIFLARSVTRPMQRLGEAANRLGQGEVNLAIPRGGPAEVRRFADTFARMAQSIRERTGELEAANRAKSQFLAMMSHEIRTPINAVIGYSELMEMGLGGPVTEQQAEHLARIKGSSRHLLGLINDVLDFSKVEAGEMEVWREPTPFRGTTSDALDLVGPQAAARSVTVTDESECDPNAAYIGDEDRVRQILVNLLSNAIKFTPEGGKVTLCCRLALVPGPEARVDGPGPWAAFEVADTGVGIAPEQQGRIFEPFTQAEEGHTRRHEGTGLGLTISRRFARLMGGDLTVRSTPGRGSCFVLWLPAAPGHPAGPGEGWPTAPHQIPGLTRLGDLLNTRAEELVHRLGERLRADPLIPGAQSLDRAQLENHMVTFLTDLGTTLVSLDEGGAEPALLRDGMDIKRVIAARHGEQRGRLGWSAVQLHREYEILGEEIDALLAREAPRGDGQDTHAAREILGRLLERAEHLSVEALAGSAGHG
ncbi:MAG TPA: ATP-binding protein [Longimicrobium sp.]|jgi:signal transduction histidine kinase|uniref:sensor histidine kinase n=1 Tax=Longimicrobium sp. TaxID=2029185 RepID=UPI002EDADAD1